MAFIARRYRLIVVGSLLLCLVAALALTRLRLDIDVLSMLPQGTPAFDDFRAFVSDFGQLDELIILVEGESAPDLPPFADAFASRLAALPGVHAVHARIDTAAVLDGILGRYLFNYLSEADYAELATRLTPEGIDRQVAGLRAALSAPFDLSTAQAIASDPLGLRRMVGAHLAEAYAQSGPGAQGGYFASADGRALLIFVRPTGSAFDIAFSEQLLRGVRGAEVEARRASGAQGVRVSVTGSYAFALEDAATMKWDIARYTVLALAGVLAVFYFGFRNLRILPFVAYPLAFTTLVTFAISLLLYDELNAVSICFAAILYGLSIDSGIAFYTRLLQERQRPGCEGPEGLPEAVRATLAGLWRANLAVSATTAASFWVIGFSCLGAVRQFGNLTGVGMLITIAQFYTLYPALSFYLSRMGAARAGSLETPRLERIAQVAVTHARPIVAVAVALTIAMVLLIPSLSIDAGLARLRPRESEAARVEQQIEARFGSRGGDGAVLVRGADLERALQESEAVAEHLRAYRAEGLLSSVQSVDAVLPSARVQQARLARDAALPWPTAVAELRDALARHGFVPARFEAALSALAQPRSDLARLGDAALAPLAVLIDHHVRERHGEYIVATYLQPAPGVSFGAIADRLRQDMAPLPIAVAARALLETELASVLRRELGYFFGLSLIGNALLLLLGAGSVATALAILAPVVVAVIAAFAAMAVTGTPIDPINLVVTPMMFGIGVDYGVYIAERARQQGSAPSGLRWEGRAVVVAALTTVVGFGFLGLSRYPPLASMGRLAGAGLFLCLVLSFILLPALLALVSSAKTSRAMRSANP